jgi:hypothetical protein
MPNPFPGMNPYLEDPRRWQGVHLMLLSGINTELNRILPPGFAPHVEERVYVEGRYKSYYPDNFVVQTRPIVSEVVAPPPQGQGGTAVLEKTQAEVVPCDPPLVLEYTGRTIREPFLEIRTVDEDSELISVIEVLSPTNKAEGVGRESYLSKQRDMLNSLVHLVEIDLLRDGLYTVAPDEEGTRERAGHFDYIVSLHWGGTGNRFEAWTRTLRERLPRIRIPLTPEAGSVTLDLQEVLNTAYDNGGFARSLRYDRDPVPPLNQNDKNWTRQLLAEKGVPM